MPPIVAKFKRVDTTTVNSIQAQTSGLISFQYAANGLKIRTSNAADHQSVVRYLDGRGAEEIIAGLREKCVEVGNARLIKRNIVEDCMRVVTLLLMWVITVPKRPNINNLKQLTGILNFVIRIQD